MADTPSSRLSHEPTDDSSANGTRPLDELRRLILGPEQEAIETLHERVVSPEARTQDVSSVLPEAIHHRREHGGDEALSNALAPTIETALRESVRKDPTSLADALFPVMGPAIHRSILETLRSYLESFNQIMDQSLSWRGIQWRFEAIRSGRSFTEVVLLHSLVFRVEQVFLIHKKTGLPLCHVVAPAVGMQDPSLISGMLSAIQDFVRDSFHTPEGEGINRMNVGDLDVWVEDGPYAILAIVIRGVAPRELRDRMAEVLENVHREFAAQLGAFQGDDAPFAGAGTELSRCLERQLKQEPHRPKHIYSWAAATLLILLVGGLLGYRAWQFQRWGRLVSTLREQPGLVVTGFDREHGRFVIRGLRDPLAGDPQEFVRSAGLPLNKAEFHWGAYYALDDAIVQQRARVLLGPPAGVSLEVHDGVLNVLGEAPLAWARELRSRAVAVPGVRDVRFAQLTPEQIAFNHAKRQIEAAVITFPVASAALADAGRASLRGLLADLKQVLNAPAELHGR